MTNPTSLQQQQQPKPAGPRPSLAQLIAAALLALVVLVGLTVLIAWLTIQPKRLVFSVEEGSAHDFNLAHNQLNVSFDFEVRAQNPNHRVSVYYDSIEASVVYNDQTLASGPIEPFFQPRRNVTRLEVNLVARSLTLVGPAYRDLRLEKSSGAVELDVQLRARIRFKVGLWKSRHRTVRIFCSPVLVHFSRAKSFERTSCDVEL